MKTRKFKHAAVMLCALLVVSLIPAFAAVVVEEFQGTLVITFPDGDIALLEAGDPVPAIPSGSVIEVFDGSFTLKTDAGDNITVACLENEAVVGDGASVTLSCREETGTLAALNKALEVRDSVGEMKQLAAGEEMVLQLLGLGALTPATAAGGETGLAIGDDNPPVDSRSIAASPSA